MLKLPMLKMIEKMKMTVLHWKRKIKLERKVNKRSQQKTPLKVKNKERLYNPSSKVLEKKVGIMVIL